MPIEDDIKKGIENTYDELMKMQKRFMDAFSDLPEDVEEARKASVDSFEQIRKVLDNAMEKAGSQAKEAQLQAHLGLMEAQDQMEKSRAVFDEFAKKATDDSRSWFDEFELKAHLGMMEAKEFWDKRGDELSNEFRNSAERMQEMTASALDDLQKSFANWNKAFQNQQKK
ncbi:MAG: hypothetical protein CSB44_00540 [Gammaproteobacteria bacterium]|nr:MAG: hypothetical protein CSB44_00540 [Gammaproteobacteria bacterium]